MNDPMKKAAEAKVILVPKGDDSRPCLKAFESATGIAVPAFEGRKLEAYAGGRTFLKVKGRDIPRFIAAGFGDIGLTGSDSCEEYAALDDSVAYRSFGPRMCRFVLLATAAKAAGVRRKLRSGSGIIEVASSFPELVRVCAAKKGLRLRPCDTPVCGSVEIMPRLLGVSLVADLVSSGRTARDNGLVEVADLLDIYPAIIVRASSKKPQTDIPYFAIDKIDAVLARRSIQASAGKTTDSYTVSLMRDANEAGKKAGEEFSEVMMAIAGSGDVSECESEIADLTYAQIVAAYSRGKPVRLGNVIRILIKRNRAGVQDENL